MATKTKTTTDLSAIRAIMDHPRTETTWVLRPILDAKGQPQIDKVARICIQRPADGAGRLKVAVTDWGCRDDGNPTQFIGMASGFGYDKLTAALQGMTVGGVELGDHCDSEGRPTLDTLVHDKGWTWLRS